MRAPGDTDDAYGFGNGTPSYSYTPQQPQQAAPQLPQPTGSIGFQPQPGGYGGGGWESTSGSMDGGGGPPEPSEGMRKRNLSASWKLSQTLLGEGEEDEPPILEELGINFSHIVSKTRAVLWPRRSKLDQEVIDDSDFAGPLIFCFALAAVLLLKGKVQFSYIYVVFVTGLLALWAVLNLMSVKGIDIYRTASVLGYCLLPIVLLAALSLPLDLTGAWGALFVPLTVFWCSNAAALFFVIILQADDQRWLLLYPVMLFYTGFALITIFRRRWRPAPARPRPSSSPPPR